jgi:hypothetical protein
MRFSLVRHPDAPCDAASDVTADIRRTPDGGLALQYTVRGKIENIAIAPPLTPERSHQLWRHSCFEVFVRVPGQLAYDEFNFAPSSHWAAYRFTGRRAGMTDIVNAKPPHIDVARSDHELVVTVDLAASDLPPDCDWQLGISVIIEEVGGNLSFWALSHPPGQADFHHDDCFSLILPKPE